MHTSLVTTCMIDSDRSQEKNQINILNKFHIYNLTTNNLWTLETFDLKMKCRWKNLPKIRYTSIWKFRVISNFL